MIAINSTITSPIVSARIRNNVSRRKAKAKVFASGDIDKNSSSVRKSPLVKIDRPNDYLSKAERVNGRAAMVGFASAMIDEIFTGHSISTQFQEHIGLTVAVTALVIIGTASNPKDEGYIQGFFRPETELLQGRLAMIGILSLILTESIHPAVPLF